jgi:hypothetical protein
MAILYGTQSNGETLPVLVDQFGNLLAKGINGEQGPKGEDGLPGGEGPPGKDGDPGEGVPLPYGADGTYLGIKNGIPQWLEGAGPGPKPPGPEDIYCVNLWEKYDLVDEDGNPISTAFPTETYYQMPTFSPENNDGLEGAMIDLGTGSPTDEKPDQFSLTNTFGRVLTVGWKVRFRTDKAVDRPPPSVTTNSDNAAFISSTWGRFQAQTAGQIYQNWGYVSWLLNRDMSGIKTTVSYTTRDFTDQHFYLRYFALEDAGTFALKRQMHVEEQLRQLRLTTDIDNPQ